MKLPETIKYKTEEDEILEQPTTDFVKKFVAEYKVKAIGDKTAAQVVRDVFTIAFAAKGDVELPEGLDHLGRLADHIKTVADQHREILEEEEKEKKDAKEKKAQERQLAKDQKEAEDKRYAEDQNKFNAVFENRFKNLEEKTKDNVTKAMRGITLPKSVVMSENGMGVVLSDNVTKDEIALAAASMISASEGNRTMAGALQFVIGDLVNAAHKKGIFRTKGEAAKHVKWLIEDKVGKKYSAGNVSANALMSERIPAGQRKLGVPPSLYYFAAKVVAPKLKEAKPSDQINMDKSFDAERNNVIELINDGKIATQNDLKTHVKEFNQKMGLLKETPDDLRKKMQSFLRRLFFSIFAKENLVHDEVATFLARGVDQGGETVQFTLSELSDIEQEAMNNLQNILLADYKITDLLNGKTTVKNGEGKDKEIPYYLEDPFTPPPAEPKKDDKKEEKKEEEKESSQKSSEQEENPEEDNELAGIDEEQED